MEVAPKILDFVTNEEIARFHRTINWMKAQNVEAVLDHSLVRGLSYYEGFIFEVVSGEHTVAGGGEYGLKCGSLSANACGFGIGVARLLESISSEKATTLPNLRTIFIEAKNGKLWQILAFDSLRLVDTQDARIRVYDDRIEVRGLDKNRYNVVPVERWLRFIGQ
jgi:histidyl-tRNA synthetase